MLFDALTAFLLLSGFVLLLLVSLSLPIITSIYLFSATATESILTILGTSFVNATGGAKFGVWGYCLAPIDVNVLGIQAGISSYNCTKPALGFDFNSQVASALGITASENSLSHSASEALVIYPIACGFAFLSLILLLLIIRWRFVGGSSRLPFTLTLLSTFLATALATAVFIIDIVAVVVARRDIDRQASGVTLVYGNAVWMTLGAMIALWLALLSTLLSLCTYRRQYRKSAKY